MKKRGSGILLNITSLPSRYGIGDLGPDAFRFVDFLSEAGQGFWQILPLNPTCGVYGNSPYSSFSAFAGNPLLISPGLMVEDGILATPDIKARFQFPEDRVNYHAVAEYKNRIFNLAYEKNRKKTAGDHDFIKFCSENSWWLDDYALFITVKRHFNGADWGRWPEDLRDRREDALKSWAQRLSEEINREKFLQHIFFGQWHRLKKYCGDKGIEIIGDVPIYVNYDSADVWSNPDIFKLDNQKMPVFVAGVPPDYFSPTGQLWGHPVYNWDVLRERRYSWWVNRIGHNLKLFHIVRLDHFRGFVA
ncbi:MAG: 4-alpha-glucanotransferase, partial [Nitrospirae bacterium]|nr:4-alpha-glucanotransferase [Nitrospirota bacterium]